MEHHYRRPWETSLQQNQWTNLFLCRRILVKDLWGYSNSLCVLEGHKLDIIWSLATTMYKPGTNEIWGYTFFKSTWKAELLSSSTRVRVSCLNCSTYLETVPGHFRFYILCKTLIFLIYRNSTIQTIWYIFKIGIVSVQKRNCPTG